MIRLDIKERMNITINKYIKFISKNKMMEDEVGGIWVGYDVTWSKPFRNVKELIWVPSREAISSEHQSLDLPLN